MYKTIKKQPLRGTIFDFFQFILPFLTSFVKRNPPIPLLAQQEDDKRKTLQHNMSEGYYKKKWGQKMGSENGVRKWGQLYFWPYRRKWGQLYFWPYRNSI